MNKSLLTTDKILSVLNKKGYVSFQNDTKNLNLNLVGVRTATNCPNSFDDWFNVLWKYQGVWNIRTYKITTDPGLYWLENPMNPLGTGILKEGQYRGCWGVGLHQGKYKALVQIKPLTVIRDADRDKELDFTGGKEDTGLFGLNCHHASATGESINVDKWSAACQVFASITQWNEFIALADQAAAIHGNSFTYTLIHERDFV